LTPDALEQCNPAEIHVARRAHWAASPCCGELWTGRRALWTG
jgi:hypothetical protein